MAKAFDPLPTPLDVDSLYVLLRVITKMENSFLSMSHFPGNWKEELVNSLPKQGAEDFKKRHQNVNFPVSSPNIYRSSGKKLLKYQETLT